MIMCVCVCVRVVQARFKAKLRANTTEEVSTAASAEQAPVADTKLHITPIQPKGLELVGSEAKLGTTTTAELGTELGSTTTAEEANNVIVDVGSSYSSGLADEAQTTSTILDEMANQYKQVSEMISDETKRATKSEDQIKTDFTEEVEKNLQDRQNAEKDLDTAISKETNERKEADDTRAKSENDVTESLNDQLSKLNDKVSECSQNVQKATQKANSLEAIVNAYTDKKGGGTKIAFISQYEHITALDHLHTRYERMLAKHNF